MMAVVINVISIWARLLAGCIFFLIGFEIKKIDFKKASLAIGTCLATSILLGILKLDEKELLLFQVAGEVLLILIIAYILLKIPFRKGMFLGIIFEISVRECIYILESIVCIGTKNNQIMVPGTISNRVIEFFIGLLAIVILLIIFIRENIAKYKIKIASCFGMFCLFGTIFLSGEEELNLSQDTQYMWTTFALVLCVNILILNANKQYEMEKQLAQMRGIEKEVLEKEYTELNNVYAMNAKLFHDFHNHIGMIRQLVCSEKYEKAIEYLDDLQAPILEMTSSKWSGDETIDYLINSKIVAAKKLGTNIDVQVEFPRHSNIKSVDLCAIIGNLLDNALEATGKVSNESERFILLTIRRINQMLIIKVENSFEQNLISENGQLKTTKKEGGIHGFGIKSVQTAVSKYDGMVNLSQEKNVFKAVATLSFQAVK